MFQFQFQFSFFSDPISNFPTQSHFPPKWKSKKTSPFPISTSWFPFPKGMKETTMFRLQQEKIRKQIWFPIRSSNLRLRRCCRHGRCSLGDSGSRASKPRRQALREAQECSTGGFFFLSSVIMIFCSFLFFMVVPI